MLSIVLALLIGAACAYLASQLLLPKAAQPAPAVSSSPSAPAPARGKGMVFWARWRAAWQAQKSSQALRQDLPATLDGLVSALRSGQSLEQALGAASREAPVSARGLFARVSGRLGLGERPEAALRLECEALAWPELRSDLGLLCTVVSVARATGANMAELLEQCSATLRERERIRAELRALTAQGRLSGIIVALLPLGLLLAMALIDPDLTHPMFTTPMGLGLLALGACLDACGFWLMRRMSQIEL